MADPVILSVSTVTLAAASGTQTASVTVPAGCNACIIGGAFYEDPAPVITISGSGWLTVQASESNASFLYLGGYSARGKVTATGSQTLSFNSTRGFVEGPTCQITWLQVEDPDDWELDFERDPPDANPETLSVTVNSQVGGLVIAYLGKDTSSGGTFPATPSGTTSLSTQGPINSDYSRVVSVDSPGATTTTVTMDTWAYPSMFGVSVKAGSGGGGGSTVTATFSAALAIQAARSAAASVATAVQAPQSASTSTALTIQAARTASANVAAAVLQAQSASALVQAAVQALQSGVTGVTAAIQALRTAAATLDLVIRQANALGVGVALQVQAPGEVSTAISLQVQAGAELSAALTIAVRELRQVSAAVALAVSQAQSSSAVATAAVQAGRSSSASTALVVQAAGGAGASVNLQIQDGATHALALQAAVQFSADAAAAISAAVAALRTASVGLAAAISVRRVLGSMVDLSVLWAALDGIGLSLYILDTSTLARAPQGSRFYESSGSVRPAREQVDGRPLLSSNTSRPSR